MGYRRLENGQGGCRNVEIHYEEAWRGYMELCKWQDVSVAETVPADNKGYGNFTTTSFDVTDSQTAKKVLLSLTEQ